MSDGSRWWLSALTPDVIKRLEEFLKSQPTISDPERDEQGRFLKEGQKATEQP